MVFSWKQVVAVGALFGAALSFVQDPTFMQCHVWRLNFTRDIMETVCTFGNRTFFKSHEDHTRIWKPINAMAWQRSTKISVNECLGLSLDGDLLWEKGGNLKKKMATVKCESDFLRYNDSTGILSLTCGKYSAMYINDYMANDEYGNVWCNFNESITDTNTYHVHPKYHESSSQMYGPMDKEPETDWRWTTEFLDTSHYLYRKPTLSTLVTVEVNPSSDYYNEAAFVTESTAELTSMSTQDSVNTPATTKFTTTGSSSTEPTGTSVEDDVSESSASDTSTSPISDV